MIPQCIDISRELESWYARENGQYLLRDTRQVLQGLLDTSFGYHILQLGISAGPDLIEQSPINHQIHCCERAGTGTQLVAAADELPLESDSIDVLVAHHSLDFAANPHQVLREMQRVLTPQGQLLIIGFNPYSLLGLGARMRGISAASLWNRHRPMGENRLVDWLHLLGCEVEKRTRLYSLPPLGRGRLRALMERGDAWCAKHNLALGGVYILHAVKQTHALNRPRSSLRRARLIDLTVPKPAVTPSPTPAAGVRREGKRPA